MNRPTKRGLATIFGVLFVLLIAAVYIFNFVRAPQTSGFNMTIISEKHDLITHEVIVEIQNFDAASAQPFNINFFIQNTGYQISKTANVTIYEWKPVPVSYPTYGLRWVPATTPYWEQYVNGSEIKNTLSWKPTKMALLTQTGTVSTTYGNINIPKYLAKTKTDDFGNSYDIDGKKRFKITWQTPPAYKTVGMGYWGIKDANTNLSYDPWWSSNWLSRYNYTFQFNNSGRTTDVFLNITLRGISAANCTKEVRLTDGSDVEIPSWSYGDEVNGTGRNCVLSALINQTARTKSYWIYSNNPAADVPTYTNKFTIYGAINSIATAIGSVDNGASFNVTWGMKKKGADLLVAPGFTPKIATLFPFSGDVNNFGGLYTLSATTYANLGCNVTETNPIVTCGNCQSKTGVTGTGYVKFCMYANLPILDIWYFNYTTSGDWVQEYGIGYAYTTGLDNGIGFDTGTYGAAWQTYETAVDNYPDSYMGFRTLNAPYEYYPTIIQDMKFGYNGNNAGTWTFATGGEGGSDLCAAYGESTTGLGGGYTWKQGAPVGGFKSRFVMINDTGNERTIEDFKLQANVENTTFWNPPFIAAIGTEENNVVIVAPSIDGILLSPSPVTTGSQTYCRANVTSGGENLVSVYFNVTRTDTSALLMAYANGSTPYTGGTTGLNWTSNSFTPYFNGVNIVNCTVVAVGATLQSAKTQIFTIPNAAPIIRGISTSPTAPLFGQNINLIVNRSDDIAVTQVILNWTWPNATKTNFDNMTFTAGDPNVTSVTFDINQFQVYQYNVTVCDGSNECVSSDTSFYVGGANIQRCTTLSLANWTYSLGTSLNTTGTCFSVMADNITIEGNGYTVNYSGDSDGYGVTSTGRNNITIRNLNIQHLRGDDEEYAGINIVGPSENNRIENVTVYNSSAKGIYAEVNNSVFFMNNITSENIAVYLSDSIRNNLTKNNFTSTGAYYAVEVYGGSLVPDDGTSHSNQFYWNRIITTYGDGTGGAMNLNYAHNNTFANNTITDYAVGVWFQSSRNNTFTNDNITGTIYLDQTFGTGYETDSSGNNFTNINFSKFYLATKTTYFTYLNGTFEHRTNITSGATVTRQYELISTTDFLWNDTSTQFSGAVPGKSVAYTIGRLLPNTYYEIRNSTVLSYTKKSMANGFLNFTISARSATMPMRMNVSIDRTPPVVSSISIDSSCSYGDYKRANESITYSFTVTDNGEVNTTYSLCNYTDSNGTVSLASPVLSSGNTYTCSFSTVGPNVGNFTYVVANFNDTLNNSVRAYQFTPVIDKCIAQNVGGGGPDVSKKPVAGAPLEDVTCRTNSDCTSTKGYVCDFVSWKCVKKTTFRFDVRPAYILTDPRMTPVYAGGKYVSPDVYITNKEPAFTMMPKLVGWECDSDKNCLKDYCSLDTSKIQMALIYNQMAPVSVVCIFPANTKSDVYTGKMLIAPEEFEVAYKPYSVTVTVGTPTKTLLPQLSPLHQIGEAGDWFLSDVSISNPLSTFGIGKETIIIKPAQATVGGLFILLLMVMII